MDTEQQKRFEEINTSFLKPAAPISRGWNIAAVVFFASSFCCGLWQTKVGQIDPRLGQSATLGLGICILRYQIRWLQIGMIDLPRMRIIRSSNPFWFWLAWIDFLAMNLVMITVLAFTIAGIISPKG